ncbi:MAG: triose-phosphate isomerase family protein [Candidatus Curtissbacteria bacterium]|nr:triose-phosphate isomerase family protein [Candidatus Curtissbacteria bacterium]
MENLPLVVANFKANKTWDEVSSWIDEIGPAAEKFGGTIVVCPPMAFLGQTAEKIAKESPKIKIAVQDISQFAQGRYTGEVAASQIKGLAAYAIIGHSERRTNFGEDDKILTLKVQMAKEAGIEPIFCIQDENTMIPEGIEIVAYEPVFAVGTGNPDSPQNVKKIAQAVKQKRDLTVLYGGSVTADNAKSFLEEGAVDGVLIGQRSTDAQFFLGILKSI